MICGVLLKGFLEALYKCYFTFAIMLSGWYIGQCLRLFSSDQITKLLSASIHRSPFWKIVAGSALHRQRFQLSYIFVSASLLSSSLLYCMSLFVCLSLCVTLSKSVSLVSSFSFSRFLCLSLSLSVSLSCLLFTSYLSVLVYIMQPWHNFL